MQDTTLQLKAVKDCDGVKLHRNNCDWLIKLPPGKTFAIGLDLELTNNIPCPAHIRMTLKNQRETLRLADYHAGKNERNIHIKDKQVWKTPANSQNNYLEIRLIIPQAVKVNGGKLRIAEVCLT